MKSYLTDFNEISKALAEQGRAQAVHDLNNEMAGRDVGRISRFLGENHAETISERRRGKDSSGDILDLALLPAMTFDELYDYAGSRLHDAETATERALDRAEASLSTSRHALETALDRAATLPDGTRVFRDEDGQVWNEHRERIDPALAATIEWQGYEPDYETFLIRRDAVIHDQDRIDAIRGYQVTLGEHRETLQDKGNLTRDDIEDLIERIETDMPEEVAAELADVDRPEPTVSSTAPLPVLQ